MSVSASEMLSIPRRAMVLLNLYVGTETGD